MDFAVLADHWVKLKESDKKKKKISTQTLLENWKKNYGRATAIPIVISALDTATGGLGKKTREDQPNYSIVEINQNTKKSPGGKKLKFFVNNYSFKKLVLTQIIQLHGIKYTSIKYE